MIVKTTTEIEKIAHAGKILAEVMRQVAKEVRPGITPRELDKKAQEYIEAAGCAPAFLYYQPEGAKNPYPATICASNNEVVVHGVPNDAPLKEGDVFSIDMGVKYEGYNADMAITVGVGKVGSEAKKLIRVTREALIQGIAAAKAGNHLGDIGHAIESHVKKNGFAIVRGLTGHGIGKKLHEEPSVFNEGEPGQGRMLVPGMCLAIEPMVSLGSSKIIQLDDEGYATSDNSLAAHFEHTIVITEKGPKILTQ